MFILNDNKNKNKIEIKITKKRKTIHNEQLQNGKIDYI
jgi:hypothetical protein